MSNVFFLKQPTCHSCPNGSVLQLYMGSMGAAAEMTVKSCIPVRSVVWLRIKQSFRCLHRLDATG